MNTNLLLGGLQNYPLRRDCLLIGLNSQTTENRLLIERNRDTVRDNKVRIEKVRLALDDLHHAHRGRFRPRN